MTAGRQQDRAVLGKEDVHALEIRDVQNEKMPWGGEAKIDLGDRAFESNGDGKGLSWARLLRAGTAKARDRKPDEQDPAKHWHDDLRSLSTGSLATWRPPVLLPGRAAQPPRRSREDHKAAAADAPRRRSSGSGKRGLRAPGSPQSPLRRRRLDDHAGRAGAREGDPGMLDRGLDQGPDIPVIEVRRGLEGHAADFGARALEKTLRVGEGLVEVQQDPARKDRHGDDGLVPAVRHPERHHERVGVVVHELIGAGERAAEFGQTPLDQRDDLAGESRQERGKLCVGAGLASGYEFTLPQEKVGTPNDSRFCCGGLRAAPAVPAIIPRGGAAGPGPRQQQARVMQQWLVGKVPGLLGRPARDCSRQRPCPYASFSSRRADRRNSQIATQTIKPTKTTLATRRRSPAAIPINGRRKTSRTLHSRTATTPVAATPRMGFRMVRLR